MTASKRGGGLGTKALVSIDEAAILIGISRSTAYRAIATNSFPVPIIRVGGRWRISRQALRRLLDGDEPAAGQYSTSTNPLNVTATGAEIDPQIRESTQSDSTLCGTCGSPRSTSVAVPFSSRPICLAARRSSSGTESV